MNNKKAVTLTGIFLSAVLSGCNSDSSDSSDNDTSKDDLVRDGDTYSKIQIDASSRTDYTYVSMSDGVVGENDDWQIAFKRLEVILNDGIEASLVEAQTEFYDANGVALSDVFINADATDEESKLTNAVAGRDAAYAGMGSDYAINNDYTANNAFVSYDMTRHVLPAVDNFFWIVKSADGNAYAKLRVTQIAADGKTYNDADAYDTAIIELAVATDANSTFADPVNWQISTPNGTGEACYDIDTASVVDCTSTTWDVSYSNANSVAPTIKLNSGISGTGSAAALGPYEYANYDQYASAIQDVSNDDFDLSQSSWTFGAAQDADGSIFSRKPWYEYNIQGNHGIWPNYRVYHVRDSNNPERSAFIQLINYYNDALVSGHITLRYRN